jgi:flagellar export protein FliJ
MRFQFHLEGLLRVRSLLERQARERLEASLSSIRALEHDLDEAARWSRQTAKISSTKKLLPAAELQFIESVLRQTGEAIAHCQRRKQAEEQRAAELRAAYLDARRERKTVSTLRENALHRFQTEQSRREQSELDEIYLGKLVHSRNAAAQDGSQANP